MAGKKTIIDGLIFDSKFEAQSYLLFKEAGLLEKVHMSFELFPAFEYIDTFDKKRKYSSIIYTPDFLLKGNIVVEIKGVPTGEYMLRKKLFIMKYNKEYKFVQLNSTAEVKEFIEKVLNK